MAEQLAIGTVFASEAAFRAACSRAIPLALIQTDNGGSGLRVRCAYVNRLDYLCPARVRGLHRKNDPDGQWSVAGGHESADPLRTVTKFDGDHVDHPAELVPGRLPLGRHDYTAPVRRGSPSRAVDADSDSLSELDDSDASAVGSGGELVDELVHEDEAATDDAVDEDVPSRAQESVPAALAIGTVFDSLDAFDEAIRAHDRSSSLSFGLRSGGYQAPLLAKGGQGDYIRVASRTWRCGGADLKNLRQSCGFFVRATQSTWGGVWCVWAAGRGLTAQDDQDCPIRASLARDRLGTAEPSPGR